MGALQGPLPGSGTYRIRRRLPRLAWSPRMRSLKVDPADGLDAFFAVDDLAGLALLPVLLLCGLLLVLLAPVLILAAEVLLILLLAIPLGVLLLVLGVRRHQVLLVREADGMVVHRELARGPGASWRAGRRIARMVRDGALPAA